MSEPSPELKIEDILRSLRRKEGNWVQWGLACQQLQKAGYSPQAVFEATGFEPIQQNQVMVAAQVYAGLVNHDAPEHVLTHFQHKGSDSLYELRILPQGDRVAVAELLVNKKIDSEGCHDVVKDVKEFSRLTKPPVEFTAHPGDAVAYACWKNARQKSDLQERSRLIARGLSFAHTESARSQIEKLLTDFTVVKGSATPRLPIYRLDDDTDSPRIMPIVGKFPLTRSDLQVVPIITEEGVFNIVKHTGAAAWVTVPGWQVVIKAEDPVAILVDRATLIPDSEQPEELLVICDRAQRQWQKDSYFLIEETDANLGFQYFDEAPEQKLLAQVVLIMRPKQIFDQESRNEIWQLEE